MLQISYDSSVMCDQLGSSDGVQDENIKEYMRMVGDRVNELLALRSYLHFRENSSQWVCGHETPLQWTVEKPSPQPVQTRCRHIAVFSFWPLLIESLQPATASCSPHPLIPLCLFNCHLHTPHTTVLWYRCLILKMF